MTPLNIKNEDGSALVTVIVFILVVTLTITLILQFNRRQQVMLTQKGLKLQVHHNAESIVHKLLSAPNIKTNYEQTSLFGNDTTSYSIEPWGLYFRIRTESKIKNISSKRTFLVGRKKDNRFGSGLILGNTQNPLILTGGTFIEGDVIVGINGVRSGVLKGKRFKSQSLVLGRVIRKGDSQLPHFKPALNKAQTRSGKNQGSNFNITGNKIYLGNGRYNINQQQLNELQNSGIEYFIGPGRIECDGNTLFENISLLNQVEVTSDSSITFSSNVRTEQVLIKANVILLQNNGQHRGQFIAKSWLKAENTELKYPSALAVINRDKLPLKRFLQIGANVKIEGSVILHTETIRQDESEKIYIDATSQINGFVYSNRFSEVYGEIRGLIMTQSFYLYSSPTTYINWINGAAISRPAFAGEFCIPVDFSINEGFTIISEL